MLRFTIRPDAVDAKSHTSHSHSVIAARDIVSARCCAPSSRPRDARAAFDWLRRLAAPTTLGRGVEETIGIAGVIVV